MSKTNSSLRCVDCGYGVTVGQGKWIGDGRHKHKTPDLCQKAAESTKVKSASLEAVRKARGAYQDQEGALVQGASEGGDSTIR